jgi:hypothetical protein
MVEHTVWFKLKDAVTDEQKQEMMAGLRALRGQIEGIEHLACGEDFSGRSKGYQIGLVVRLVSRAALEVYGPHPVHQAFLQKFRPLWDDVVALDLEDA